MVILVTGACGYLGSELIRELPRVKEFEGETIRIMDNMFRDRFVSLFDLPSGRRYEMVHGDVRDEEKVRIAMKDVTHVFSLSDITNAPLSFERKDLTFETNYEGALKVYTQASNSGVERFIYTSTASVYGLTKDIVDETFDCNPKSPYGEYKLKAEKEMQKRSRENGFSWTALRLGTVVGQTIGMRFDTVIDKFTFYASIGHSLTVWETALQEARPYVEVRDVTRSYIFSMNNNKMDYEVYNVVAENLNMHQVIERIKKYFPNVDVKISPAPDLNQASYVLSSDKIKKVGFKFNYTIDDGINKLASKFSGLSEFKQ
ncbi:MAG: NAD(P)-dependent oxidoreductase [Candidatus Thorarchaeota archaeon]|nr:NAD(P)-dependent oxidoreductase [Candidatus Thorarchaeota archaeon]